MNDTGQIITEDIVNRLPSGHRFFRPRELRAYGIPDFLTDRIEVDIEQQLHDSLVLPDTRWADMTGEPVQDAWMNVLKEAAGECRLPAEQARSIIESAVRNTLIILVQPRKAIPRQLFGSGEKLDRDVLHERVKKIVVHRHLATALVRFLQRRDRQSLTREQCINVVSKVDEKLVSSYRAEDWADHLAPLFLLSGGKVDSDLLCVFFQDKERQDLAQLFELKTRSVTRTELIGLLSSAGSEIGSETRSETGSEPTKAGTDEREDSGGSALSEAGSSPNTAGDTLHSLIRSRSEGNQETAGGDSSHSPMWVSVENDEENDDETDEDGHIPLHSKFMLDEDPVDETGETAGPDQAGGSAGDRGFGEQTEEQAADRTDGTERTADEPTESLDSGISGEETEINYIWQNFMQGDPNESEENGPEESAEQTREIPDVKTTHAGSLAAWMEDDAERFTDFLFKGSDRAYEEATDDISELSNWREAAEYIEREIFSRNHIDMYDETAVDFTDRLHSYFIEHKSS
ncbi:MAG: hypothetical protein WD317_07860 [Balneolaceae bacterium]